jgi:hypothetical protein
MNSVERFFLRAKHWQIFALLVGVCFLGQMTVVSSMATPLRSPEDFDKTARLLGAATVVFMLFFLGWLWSMGSFLTSIIAEPQRLPLRYFRLSLIYPAIYVMYFFSVISTSKPPSALIVPFHLLAMFCMFYNLYFVSKSLVLAETGRAASFYDYAGPFFLTWFFPVGIWVIQPRINRLFEKTLSGHAAA